MRNVHKTLIYVVNLAFSQLFIKVGNLKEQEIIYKLNNKYQSNN